VKTLYFQPIDAWTFIDPEERRDGGVVADPDISLIDAITITQQVESGHR
jgi:hypothetical protein